MNYNPLEGKRLFYLIIDQLAGHWVEGVEIEGMPPPNVKSYHELRLIPNFSYLISKGIWVRKPWNMGVCNTAFGMKYLSTGSYDSRREVGFFEYVRLKYNVKVAAFTTTPWTMKGYFYVPDPDNKGKGIMISLPPYHPDKSILLDYVLPFLIAHHDWSFIHVYFPLNDKLVNIPAFSPKEEDPFKSKHAYLLYLDKLLGKIVRFLKLLKYWDETLLVIASDHAYHLACEACRKLGVSNPNWVCDHVKPYDCRLWNFKEDRPLEKYSKCVRRITMIFSGGLIPHELRGSVIEEAEIIDVIPTIASLLGIDYKSEGKNLLNLL